MDLIFMSFNIQHGFDYVRKDRIDLRLMTDAITSCGADIIGLNEVRGRGRRQDYTAQVEEMAHILGYHCYFAQAVDFGDAPGNAPYGNAILSKYPIMKAESIAVPDPEIKDEDAYYETRCILKADFDVSGKFTVFVTHVGLAKSEQKNAIATIVPLLDAADVPHILMGDFNMTPNNTQLAPIFERMMDTAALFDSLKLSFPSDAPKMKIDYIFASRDVSVKSADIPAIIASDHRPHTATVKF